MDVPPKFSVSDLQEMIGRSRFHQLFDPKVHDVDNDALRLVIKFSMSEAFERQPGTGQWHGGAISAIIDTTGCYALALLAAEPLPTINFRVDYLRPGIATDLTAIGQVRRAGKRVGVVDVDVHDDKGRLIALGRSAYARAQAQPPK
jgi:uncharacterized protein (TIGR00369 family)